MSGLREKGVHFHYEVHSSEGVTLEMQHLGQDTQLLCSSKPIPVTLDPTLGSGIRTKLSSQLRICLHSGSSVHLGSGWGHSYPASPHWLTPATVFVLVLLL